MLDSFFPWRGKGRRRPRQVAGGLSGLLKVRGGGWWGGVRTEAGRVSARRGGSQHFLQGPKFPPRRENWRCNGRKVSSIVKAR